MENVVRLIPNIAVSVFAVIVGFKMWFNTQGSTELLALIIIIIGVSALETNIISIMKRRRSHEAR
jgi:predicted PurR-regulated permease PerM